MLTRWRRCSAYWGIQTLIGQVIEPLPVLKQLVGQQGIELGHQRHRQPLDRGIEAPHASSTRTSTPPGWRLIMELRQQRQESLAPGFYASHAHVPRTWPARRADTSHCRPETPERGRSRRRRSRLPHVADQQRATGDRVTHVHILELSDDRGAISAESGCRSEITYAGLATTGSTNSSAVTGPLPRYAPERLRSPQRLGSDHHRHPVQNARRPCRRPCRWACTRHASRQGLPWPRPHSHRCPRHEAGGESAPGSARNSSAARHPRHRRSRSTRRPYC